MESFILIILVTISGVCSGQLQVFLNDQCALKGTSVVIQCSYDYPLLHFVNTAEWSKARYESSGWKLYPVSRFSSDPKHFEDIGNYYGDCKLKINNVQDTDEGPYYFGFATTLNRKGLRKPFFLTVKGLTTIVEPSTVTEGENVRLTCVPGCDTSSQFVWFRDGQPVRKTVFQARTEDAGRYYCALLGQENIKSVPVALNVQYAPKKVMLSVSPSGDFVKGSAVSFSCHGDANPPVKQNGYSLYKDGKFFSLGQNHTIADLQLIHNGQYYCTVWNNISWNGFKFFNSAKVTLDVKYDPMNISISMDPPDVGEGSSVNLTCSSEANPTVDVYTWYKRSASSGSMLEVGSGPVLSLFSVEASHTGHYICHVRNRVGENNSTEMLLSVRENKKAGSGTLPVLAGTGVLLFVALALALFFWKKQTSHSDRKTSFNSRLNGRSSSSSATEDQFDNVYANIHMAQDDPSPLQMNAHQEHHDSTSHEEEVTYSTVAIKPRNPTLPHHAQSGPEDSVIYASVMKSS